VKDEILNAINIAQAEVTGKRPREAKNEAVETPRNALDGFFASGAAECPPKAPNAPMRPAAKNGKSARYRGQIVGCADGTSRNISECWQDLFARNERMFLSDTELQDWMDALFPDRAESKNFHHVQRIRSQYNSGRLPGMSGRPEIQSRRFSRVGTNIYVLNARGRAIGVIDATKVPHMRPAGISENKDKSRDRGSVRPVLPPHGQIVFGVPADPDDLA
jgi:hypothetical protein